MTEYASAACSPSNGVNYIANSGSTCALTDADTNSGVLNNTSSPTIYASGGSILDVSVTAPLTINQSAASGNVATIRANGGSQVNFTGDQKVTLNVLRSWQYGIQVEDTSSVNFDNDVEINFATNRTGNNINRSIYMTGGTLNIAGHLSISDTTNAAAGVSIGLGSHLNLNSATIVMGQVGSGLRFEDHGDSQIYSSGLIEISTNGGGTGQEYSAAIRGNKQGVMDLDSLKTYGINGAYGVSLTNNDVDIRIRNNAEIVTEGDLGIGVNISGTGKFFAGSGSIVTSGNNAAGFSESNSSSSGIDRNLTLDVSTHGTTSHAVQLNASAGDVLFTTSKTLRTDQISSNALNVTAAVDKNAIIDFKGTINSSGIGININQANIAAITNDQNASITAINGKTGIDVHNVLTSSMINNYGDITVDSGALAIFGGSAFDTVNIFSGTVTGDIQLGVGHDVFNAFGGRIKGSVYLGDGNDVATLSDSVNLSDMPRIDGGSGIDILTIKGLSLSGYTDGSNDVSKGVNLTSWNTLLLTDGAVLTQNANLFDATKTSTLLIDDSSKWQIAAASPASALKITGSVQNSGQMNLANNGITGDLLTITGNYQGNNGLISFDTYLNDDYSVTDKLIIQGGTSGQSLIQVYNQGGSGAETHEGIQLIEVGGYSGGSFKLGSRVTAGLYEYDLYQGGTGVNAADGNWYLRSMAGAINPESTVYLRNLNAAATMFIHTLHDRLGEPQFTDPYKTDDSNPSSAWVRVVSNHTNSVGGNGQVDLNTDTNLVHLGADIARWSNDGNDRWLVGLMGAYGQSKIDASAKYFAVTPSGFQRNASGKVDGYSIGAYATWYDNQDKPEGAYVDTWAQYGWYDNKVQGNTKREESYNSSGWTASVEAGYAMIARSESKDRQWIFEPQVQVAYNHFTSDDYTDVGGTRITDNNANGVITRVGARLYGRSTANDNGIQPFVEANWWYSDVKNSLSFNGQTMSDGTPDSRYEVKAGLQGEIAKNWLMWGHVGVQFGENDYNRYEGMAGIKRVF